MKARYSCGTKFDFCTHKGFPYVCVHFKGCQYTVTSEIYFWCCLLCFKLPGSPAAFFIFLFSQHQFVQHFLQLCVSAWSQWTYCTLFALASQSPASKQCLVSLGPETVIERSQARGATVLEFHHALMLLQCLWLVMLCEKWGCMAVCEYAHLCWLGIQCGHFF